MNEGKSTEMALPPKINALSLISCNQGPSKRDKSVTTAKSVSYEDESCIGCSYILLKVQKLEKELAALRELVQANDVGQNAVKNARISKTKGKNKTPKQPKKKVCEKSQCKDADTHDDGEIATESPVSMDDNRSEPSTSLSHSACSVEPSVGSEETSSWQGRMGKPHNRSIKPQTTPVDLLRPSAVKAAGNRTNEPLDRQHCVVVQGLSESNAPTPKERMSADLDMLQHLLNKMLNSTEKITIRAAFRIGKKASEQSETVRPRPLKIVLGSKEEASLLLSGKSSLRNSHKEVFSAGLFSSGTSETPRISDGAEEETCSGREQLGYFQGASDTEECDVALEPASHHDGGSNIILANPRQIERSTYECCKLTFFYTNAQSLFSKLDELRIQVADTPPDVIAVTETWLSENVGDCEVALTGYQLLRRDRRGRRGGGVAMYVKSNLTVCERTDKIPDDTEAIWLTIKHGGLSPSKS
ncbi:hypothetical protein SprV_0301254500 [Sparganum proliferum]